MSPEGKHEAVAQTLQAVPSLAAIGSYLLGLTVEKWLAVAGIAFICLQAIGYIWRLRRDIRRERERERERLSALSDDTTDRADL